MYEAIERVIEQHKRAFIGFLCEDFRSRNVWVTEDQVWQPELREFELLQFYILHYTPDDESCVERMLYLQNWINGTPDNPYLHLEYETLGGDYMSLVGEHKTKGWFSASGSDRPVGFNFTQMYSKKKPRVADLDTHYKQLGKWSTYSAVRDFRIHQMLSGQSQQRISFAVRVGLKPKEMDKVDKLRRSACPLLEL